jgi:hypothetical protein
MPRVNCDSHARAAAAADRSARRQCPAPGRHFPAPRSIEELEQQMRCDVWQSE